MYKEQNHYNELYIAIYKVLLSVVLLLIIILVLARSWTRFVVSLNKTSLERVESYIYLSLFQLKK